METGETYQWMILKNIFIVIVYIHANAFRLLILVFNASLLATYFFYDLQILLFSLKVFKLCKLEIYYKK